jgi:hypothetical protein
MYAAGERHPCQVKLLHFTINDYFKDDALTPVNTTRMEFASYNAGPAPNGAPAQGAAKMGWTNQWFGKVELKAAKDIGVKPYVSSVSKYSLAYKLIEEGQPPLMPQ